MKNNGREVRVRGVHPVADHEEVWLIEMEVAGGDGFDWGSVTQEDDEQPESDWQTAWDEQSLGTVDGMARFAFFFHFLRLDRPLQTPAGPVELPHPSTVPDYLAGFSYEAP